MTCSRADVRCTTMGAAVFHFCVRNGNRWYRGAIAARQKGRNLETGWNVSSTGFGKWFCKGRSRQPPDVLRGCAARTFGSLVPASSTPRGASTSGLSTSWSPTFLIGLKPGTTHLGACFPLRCFQRLSVPDLAAGRCHWRDSPKTSGPFTPVLSY